MPADKKPDDRAAEEIAKTVRLATGALDDPPADDVELERLCDDALGEDVAPSSACSDHRARAAFGRTRSLIETSMTSNAADGAAPVFQRLADIAQRGATFPECLTMAEVRQVSFALSLCLGEES